MCYSGEEAQAVLHGRYDRLMRTPRPENRRDGYSIIDRRYPLSLHAAPVRNYDRPPLLAVEGLELIPRLVFQN